MELLPSARYLILCEEMISDSLNPKKITLVGLISAIRNVDEAGYPLLYRELCVFLQFTGCRGVLTGRVEIRLADSDQLIFETKTRAIPFPSDPLEIVAVSFRVRNCLFPIAGLYWVQFHHNDILLAQQALILR